MCSYSHSYNTGYDEGKNIGVELFLLNFWNNIEKEKPYLNNHYLVITKDSDIPKVCEFKDDAFELDNVIYWAFIPKCSFL